MEWAQLRVRNIVARSLCEGFESGNVPRTNVGGNLKKINQPQDGLYLTKISINQNRLIFIKMCNLIFYAKMFRQRQKVGQLF